METTIVYILTYIIEAFILWLYCSIIFTSRYSKLLEFFILLTGYSTLYFISLLKSFEINIIAFSLINYIIIKLLYDIKWYSTIFHSLIITSVMCLSEVIMIGINVHIINDFVSNDSYNSTLFIMTSFGKILYFLLIRIIISFMHGAKEKYAYPTITTVLLNTIPLISIYIMITFTSILLNINIPKHLVWMLSSSAMLLLLINITIFYVYYYTQKKNNEFATMQLQLQKEYDRNEYYKALFKQDENQQILIHDIKNHLHTLDRLNEQNDQQKIKHYLENLINSSDLQSSVHVCDNELLNSILCHYIQLCKNNNITFKTDIRKKLLTNLEYDDLTSLFCNLLDNAVEACSNIPDSYIELIVTYQHNANLTVISMANSCNTRPVFNKSGRPVTTKNNKCEHGFGLKSVQRIVDKFNGNIKMYFDEEQMNYHTIITLK